MSKLRVSQLLPLARRLRRRPRPEPGEPARRRRRWRCTNGLFGTRTFRKMFGQDGGATGIDDDFAARGFANVGAWILGRNMFGPIRGDWPDESWKGWWGDNPPYHCPVFVLTHHPRASITMEGGTTFHFVTDGHPRGAATRARGRKRPRRPGRWRGRHDPAVSAGRTDRRDASGRLASPARQRREPLCRARLRKLGYSRTEHVTTPIATHIVLTKTGVSRCPSRSCSIRSRRSATRC